MPVLWSYASITVMFMDKLFLQVALVVDMVEGYSKKEKLDDEEIFRRIKRDPYMEYAVTECYELLMDVLCGIIIGKQERR
jgi:hypothetical protein